MSVNMLRLRFTTDCQPRVRATASPPTARSAEEELEPVRRLRPEHLVEPGHVPAHLERKHGKVSTVPIQKRRVKSASSGLGGSRP